MFRRVLSNLFSSNRYSFQHLRIKQNRYCSSSSSSNSEQNQNQSKTIGNIDFNEKSRRMLIQFRCKICDQTLKKTFNRQSYEQGVVLIRCDSCENLHLIADNLGWFKDLTNNGKFKNIVDLLKSKNEETKIVPLIDEKIIDDKSSNR